MAQDSDLSKAADKGKGKEVDGEKKPEEVPKDKDGNPTVNGKKEDDKNDGLFAPSLQTLPRWMYWAN